MIIGLTGTIASGKSTVAMYLKSKGFEHRIYSDYLRIIARKRSLPESRLALQKLGNELKLKTPGILSKMIVKNAKNIIADGIRTLEELNELKNNPEVIVIGIDADQKIRYNRLRKRKRTGDPNTFQDFQDIDNHENEGKTPGQNISECLKAADYLILNNNSTKELHKEIDKILNILK